MATRLRDLRDRALRRAGFITKGDFNNLRKALQDAESRRSPVPETSLEYMNKIVQIPYNYDGLIELAERNEVVRTVHEAIIKEVIRTFSVNTFVKPRFQRKCPRCGTEFKTDRQICPDCDVETKKPDLEQKQTLEAFVKAPNRDDKMRAIVQSLIRFGLSVDDWWLSIIYADMKESRPLAIYVEDSAKMRVCSSEENGVLGNGQYFCPKCTKKDPAKFYGKGEHCPAHPEVELKETAYVHLEGNDIKARFSRDEIIHGRACDWLPRHYGLSKLVSALWVLNTLIAMNRWNYDTYTTGKLAQILGFKGMNQEDVNKMLAAVDEARKKAEEDPNTGVTSRKLRTLGLGLGPDGAVTAVDTMPPSDKMQSLDWWKLWREIVCSIYGVTPIFVGVVESGKTGNNPRMQIDVQNNTTETTQSSLEDPLNEGLVPKLGVTDWILQFDRVESKDEMQEIQVLQTKIETVIRAANAGMNAELTDEGEVKVSGKPTAGQFEPDITHVIKPYPGAKKPGGAPAGPFAQKPSAFEQENTFAQEKAVKDQVTVGNETYVVTRISKSEEHKHEQETEA